jgi:hypothetical protein
MNQAKAAVVIENPREYETCVVEQLQRLLQAGTPARPDPRRPHFYEITGEDETYYIHISPFTANVVLLAKWTRQPQDCCLGSSCAMA